MAFARGKNSLAISDRSGMAFPYTEMVREWNGSLVHYSEYEAKHPQLEPKPRGADPQGLQNARPARTEPAVARILDENPLTATSGSTTISVYEDNHGRSTGNTVRFRNGETFFAITDLNNASGFTITVVDANNYTFNSTDTANGSGKFGGGSISAGPVTLTA